MDARVRNAIAKIVVQQDGEEVRGTGVLVGDGLVLTALHVVADRHTDPPRCQTATITLQFPAHRTSGHIVEQYCDATHDWVLLRCDQTPPNVTPLPLAELQTSGVDWQTYGFPDAQPRDGLVLSGEVDNHN